MEMNTENEKLHFHVKNDDIGAVKEWFDKFPNHDKHILNSGNVSAVATALMKKNLVIYTLLMQKGCEWAPSDVYKEIKAHLSISENDQLRSIHERLFTIELYDVEYVRKLVKKSRFSLVPGLNDFDFKEYRRNTYLINLAFYSLNENELIVPILKVVSQAENLRITFDLKSESTEVMVPNTNRNFNGAFIPGEEKVYVCAKDLFQKEINKICGVIVHELCHCAMKLLYRNDCKPYLKENNAVEDEFNLILVKILGNVVSHWKRNENAEAIIDVVFKYDLSQWKAELIVRIPQLLAHYKEHPTKIEEMKKMFKELFYFYENTTLVDLERQLMMEAENNDNLMDIH